VINLPALDASVPPGTFDPFISSTIQNGDPGNEIDLLTGVEEYRFRFTPWDEPETFPP